MNICDLVKGNTRLIGVIGNPIEHSISPQLHNTLSSKLGKNLMYVPFRVDKEELQNAIKGLKALNVLGFNVTIPYKKDVMDLIDEISKEALLIGAVNTIKNDNGRLYGYNTDAEGFSRSFKHQTGVGFDNKSISILGAGGTARAVAVKLAIENAASINIINRTVDKAFEIAGIVNNNIKPIVNCFDSNSQSAVEILKESDIIINTTSAGMHPQLGENPLPKTFAFSDNQIAYDVIYNPSKTKFLETAGQKGCISVNGFGMLIYQGIFAYEIWTGLKIDDEIILEIFDSFTNYLKN